MKRQQWDDRALCWWMLLLALVANNVHPAVALVENWISGLDSDLVKKIDKRIHGCGRDPKLLADAEETKQCIKGKLIVVVKDKGWLSKGQADKVLSSLTGLLYEKNGKAVKKISSTCVKKVKPTTKDANDSGYQACVSLMMLPDLVRTMDMKSNHAVMFQEYLLGWGCPKKMPWYSLRKSRKKQCSGNANQLCEFDHQVCGDTCVPQSHCTCNSNGTWSCRQMHWSQCRYIRGEPTPC